MGKALVKNKDHKGEKQNKTNTRDWKASEQMAPGMLNADILLRTEVAQISTITSRSDLDPTWREDSGTGIACHTVLLPGEPSVRYHAKHFLSKVFSKRHLVNFINKHQLFKISTVGRVA